MIRRYEQEVKEKRGASALGEMALGVVHEVKNPLTSIKGFTQLLTHPGIPEEKRKQYVERIDSELNRVNRLLNEMLLYGGRSRLELRKRDVLAILRDRTERCAPCRTGSPPQVRVLRGIRSSPPWTSSSGPGVRQCAQKRVRAVCRQRAGQGRRSGPADEKKIELAFVDTGCGVPP